MLTMLTIDIGNRVCQTRGCPPTLVFRAFDNLHNGVVLPESIPTMSDPEKADPDVATTLVKGLAVLEAFTTEQPLMSNAEIGQRTGIHRSTVARLTYTLDQLGYLKQEKSKFRLGWRALVMINPLIANLGFITLARPLMRQLAQEFGGTVSIGTIDNTSFVYLDTCRVNENTWNFPDLGAAGSLLSATMGHAACSLLSQDELATKIAELMAADQGLWQKYGDFFKKGVEESREFGCSISRGVWFPDIHTVSVPLFRDQRGDCFAVNCRVPIFRLRANGIEEDVAPKLLSLVAIIREQMSLPRVAYAPRAVAAN